MRYLRPLTYILLLAIIYLQCIGYFTEDLERLGLGKPRLALLFYLCSLFNIFYIFSMDSIRFTRRAVFIFLSSALISTLFSYISEGGSIIGAYIFMTQMLMAEYLSRDRDKVVQHIILILILALIMSIFTAVYKPEIGVTIENINQQWKGLLSHKNRLGGLSAFGIVMGIIFFKNFRLAGLAIISLGLFCLFKSQSSGALIVLISVVAIYIAHSILPRRTYYYFMYVSIALALIMTTTSSELLLNSLSYFGRDASLTGRVPLWKEIFANGYINAIGYGFNNFWDPNRQNYSDISNQIGWQPFYSHNGYIEMMIILGWPVSILLIYMIIRSFAKAFRENEFFSESLIILFFILYNWSEASLTQYDNPLLVFFLFFFFRVWRSVNQKMQKNGVLDEKTQSEY